MDLIKCEYSKPPVASFDKAHPTEFWDTKQEFIHFVTFFPGTSYPGYIYPPPGQVKPDNPVKQLSLHFQFLPHIDLGSCTPSMSAVDDCYKTWKCTATHLAELKNEFDNGASGFAPV